MNEKEIERLILDNTFVGRVASFTEEYPDGEPAVRGAGVAAHAIAEKMRKGVFYKADVMNGADGRPWIDSNEANVGLTIACKKHLKEGEMFRVTFTKLEEGDG